MNVLLLNSSYEGLDFITLKDAIRLICNDKVDIISNWNSNLGLVSGNMKYPSVLKMKYYIYRPMLMVGFSRNNVFKRDENTYQYCSTKIGPFTLEHIIPKSHGGKLNWLNCVTSCSPCNNKKGDKTLEEVGLKLIRKPYVPNNKLFIDYMAQVYKHKEWSKYIRQPII